MNIYNTPKPAATETIHIRCTVADKLTWQCAAAKKGLQLGTYVKYLLKKEDATNAR